MITDSFLHEQYELVRAQGCIVVEESNIKQHGKYYRENRKIVINSDIPNHQKLTTLQHEYGHDCCFMRGCKCIVSNVNTELTETHAMIFSLFQLLHGPFNESIFCEMKRVCLYLSVSQSKNIKHRHVCYACRNLTTHWIWDECMLLEGDRVLDWLNTQGKFIEDNALSYIIKWPDL